MGIMLFLEEVKNEYNVTINESVEAVKGNQTDKYDKLATIFAFSIIPCSLVSLFSRHTKKNYKMAFSYFIYLKLYNVHVFR